MSGTTSVGQASPELLLELRPDTTLGRGVEDALRAAVRARRVTAGTRLPSTRVLARDLGVSRRLVVEAYEQLVAEGWLEARQGSGTFVAQAAPADAPGDAVDGGLPPEPERAPYDFFPGEPDLSSFPREAWLRALRDVLREAPDAVLGYPDPAGRPELRAALSAHLRRVRGAQAEPGRVIVVSGARQGLALLGRALARAGHERVAVERPSLPQHVDVLREAGLDVVGVQVDDEGLSVDDLARSGADVIVATPTHQMPLGVALSPVRRAELLTWATALDDRLIVEDDYDAEYRYDRRPVGALQGVAPAQVAYLGSASKTLAPGLRLGWLLLPERLVADVRRQKELDDGGSEVLGQLALARLLESAAYDRHLRRARRANRRRRDALVAALAEQLPGARLDGLAAGLHAIVRLPASVDIAALGAATAARGVAATPLPGAEGRSDALILGYARLSEPAIAEGVRRLAAAVADAA